MLEVRSNGCLELRISGDNPVQVLAIKLLQEAVEKGQRVEVQLALDAGDVLIVRMAH